MSTSVCGGNKTTIESVTFWKCINLCEIMIEKIGFKNWVLVFVVEMKRQSKGWIFINIHGRNDKV